VHVVDSTMREQRGDNGAYTPYIAMSARMPYVRGTATVVIVGVVGRRYAVLVVALSRRAGNSSARRYAKRERGQRASVTLQLFAREKRNCA